MLAEVITTPTKSQRKAKAKNIEANLNILKVLLSEG